MARTLDRVRRTCGVALILTALVTAVWLALAPPSAALVESCFVRVIYPRLLAASAPVTEWTSWSLTEALLAGLLLTALLSVTRALSRWRRHQWSIRRGLGHVLMTVATIAAALYLLFLASWGLLYLREPLERRMAWSALPPTDQDVLALARALMQDAVTTRTDLESQAARELERPIADAVAAVTRELDHRDVRLPTRLKWVWPRRLLAITSTTGITSPWLHEAQLDPALSALEIPFVAAHELAHVAGYASEAEANLIGYLACQRTGVRAAEYSALLALLPSAIGSLPDAMQAQAIRELDDRVRSDLNLIAERARRDRSALLASLSRAIYDAYLKQQGVPEGARDYARVITLLHDYRNARRSHP